MYNDCDMLGNSIRRMPSTKLLPPNYLLEVALLQMLYAVANVVGEITRLLSACFFVKINVAFVVGLAIRPKTSGQGKGGKRDET